MINNLRRRFSLNFIKLVGQRANTHSLLPYLYLYKFNEDNVGYVVMDPQTRQLIAIDTGEYQKSSKIIGELE